MYKFIDNICASVVDKTFQLKSRDYHNEFFKHLSLRDNFKYITTDGLKIKGWEKDIPCKW